MARDSDDFLLHAAEGIVTQSREGQVTMARAVETAIQTKTSLLVEGPVGVGKSFAYLIPSLLSGKRTIISTAQKALQQQLAGKDGPLLARAVQSDVPNASVAMLKGKANYGCLYHVGHTNDAPEFAKWLKDSETADLSEYTGRRPRMLSEATAEGCMGPRCPHAEVCGYRKSRANALKAQVVVVNHSLVAFDLRYGPFKLFGPYETLVVDEAHKAPSSFRGAFEENIHKHGAQRILKYMDTLVQVDFGVETKEISTLWDEVFLRSKAANGTLRADPFGSLGAELHTLLNKVRSVVDPLIGVASREHAEAVESVQNDKLDDKDLSAAIRLSRALHRNLGALNLLKEPGPNILLSAEHDKGNHYFKATPVSVGALVGDKLALIPATIFTSATMTVNADFGDFRRQLGLSRFESPQPPAEPKTIVELVVPTPFDYKAQDAFLYASRNVRPAVPFDGPGYEAYIQSLTREITRLTRASGGDALVLFTSTADMNTVHAELQLSVPEIPWLVQNSDTGLGAEAVMKKFRETPGSVILGLKSFWEGVSVEGDKLWLVIITKLPFPSPADPLQQAMAAQLEKEFIAKGMSKSAAGFAIFRRLALPPMVTDMRQGAGRLVRTTTDRGVLAILDTRIWTGKNGKEVQPNQAFQGYGAQLVTALGFGKDPTKPGDTGNWTDSFEYVEGRFKKWRAMKSA